VGDDEAFCNVGSTIAEGDLTEDAVRESFAEGLGEGNVCG